jgi:hypothetical protein
MGSRPVIFSEIGIPYDMDDKYAYKTGDYSSQIAAMDANMFAIEGFGGNGMTMWVYVASNTHEWGDNWNGEDLSIYSVDDRPLPNALQMTKSTTSLDTDSPSFSRASLSDGNAVRPANLKATLSSETMSTSAPSLRKTALTATTANDDRPINVPGYRAAEAYTRPVPTAVHGDIVSYGFDLLRCTFTLKLAAPSPTAESAPTSVFLPEWHFPGSGGATTVEVSGGKWEISVGEDECQRLRWWHAEGEQILTVRGVARKSGKAEEGRGYEEEAGYLEQCQKESCVLM